MNETRKVINEAQKIVAPYWPLTAFIAYNHLWNYRNKDFFKLSSELPITYLPSFTEPEPHINHSPVLYAEQVAEYKFMRLEDYICEKLYRILSRYFTHQTDISLIQLWASIETKHAKTIKGFDNISKNIDDLCNKLSIPDSIQRAYFEKIYSKIYGWSSFSKWLVENPENPWIKKQSILDEIILIWLFYEANAMSHCDQKPKYITPKNPIDHKLKKTLQEDQESRYFQPLVESIKTQTATKTNPVDAQFVFCIDTRSEGLRRHLESSGHYETFGCAGFFGVIFELIQNNHIKYQSPALLKPEKKVLQENKKTNIFRDTYKAFIKLTTHVRKQTVASLAFFEILGTWYFLYMVFKTLNNKFTKPKNIITHEKYSTPFSDNEKIETAAGFLTSIDLTKNFTPAVIICGHQTNTTNNPFNASLNCGACGGNAGVANATVISQILNEPTVREKLAAEKNIVIPESTIFYPAVHHTVHDRITFLQENPPKQIIDACLKACENLRDEKISDYPFLNNLAFNESNWAELIPELGLINNASFIIGPRTLTQNINLKRRAFLHSYNPETDENAAVLSDIFAGPCIVAHWINMQYMLSSTNPTLFGAGNKAVHNVLPKIGVMEGNLSDLKIGLPLQSTHFRDELLHEPLRLTYLVYASKKQITTALDKNPDFKLLVENHWVNLIQLDRNETNHSKH